MAIRWDKFTVKSQQAIQQAQARAAELGNPELQPVHLLLALLEAFLFPGAADLGRARQLASGARPITLGVSDATARPIAERIVLNARDAGLAVSVTPQAANADVV